MKRILLGVGALVVSALLAACGSGAATSSGASPSEAAATPKTLNVFAAASLTEVFGDLKTRFETDNPGVEVRYNFAGSSDLAQQIVNGAPADVFAAASESTMKTVTDASLTAGAPVTFATDVLQIATAPGNPKGIASFADLAKPGLTVVVCQPKVPCGDAAAKVQQATGVTLTPASEEPDVKSVLSKVTTGNADAGLVYTTDVASAKDAVTGVSFPEAEQATTSYPIATLTNAPEADLAKKFVELVTGEDGKKALGAVGFGAP